jgi:hypothetical protein
MVNASARDVQDIAPSAAVPPPPLEQQGGVLASVVGMLSPDAALYLARLGRRSMGWVRVNFHLKDALIRSN